MPPKDSKTPKEPLPSKERMLYAGLGALVPIFVLLGQLDPNQTFDEYSHIKFLGWLVRGIVLLAMGCIVGLLYYDEDNRRKLFQLGIAAPALLAAFAGTEAYKKENALRLKAETKQQQNATPPRSELGTSSIFSFFIKTANAQQTTASTSAPPPPIKTVWSEFLQGLTGVSQEPLNSNKIMINQWVSSKNGEIPNGAFQAGKEVVEDNEYPLFICLAHHMSSTQPGKIRAGLKGCNIPFGTKEIQIEDYSVLMSSSYAWKKITGNNIPSNALIAGSDIKPGFKNLYICRASIPSKDGLHPGKMRNDFGGCNVSWGGQVYVVPEYEILTKI